MHFSLAACIVISIALTGTTHGESVSSRDGVVYSGKDYHFDVLENGGVQVSPINGKRQETFCNYWDTWVVCQVGLSDTNVCTYDYCSCSGVDLDCTAGTTCSNTCYCDLYCFTEI